MILQFLLTKMEDLQAKLKNIKAFMLKELDLKKRKKKDNNPKMNQSMPIKELSKTLNKREEL